MVRPFITVLRISIMGAMCIAPLAWSAADAGEEIKISGTGTSLGTLRIMAAAFEKANPGISVKMLPSIGSGGAIKAVAAGALDIGLNSREFTPEEQVLGLRMTKYAWSPFVFAVNPGVTATGISHEEAVKIFVGDTVVWPDGQRIRLVLRPPSDADIIIAKAISPEMSAALDAALGREGMIIAATNQECHLILAKNPGGLGFSTLTQLWAERQPLKMLAYNGKSPNAGSAVNSAYPLRKTLSFVTRQDPSPAVKRFLDFVRGPEGKRILEQTGNAVISF